MAEAAWRVRLRERMASADIPLREADAALQRVILLFQSPVPSEAAAVGSPARVAWYRTRYALTMYLLAQVTRFLGSAIVHMEAAEILALRGGSVNPAVALPSIMHLGQAGAWHGVRAAITRLLVSRRMAAYACRMAGWGRGHMSTAIALLDAPGIPASVDLSDWEFSTAMNAVTGARQMTQAAVSEFTTAQQRLAP